VPHHKSAKKRVRQTVKRTEMNKVKTTMARTVLKKFKAAVDAGDKSKATELLTTSQKLLARLAKVGIIKPNTAARRTSRLATQVSKIS
jgi:small subunit ribosomal protein S20